MIRIIYNNIILLKSENACGIGVIFRVGNHFFFVAKCFKIPDCNKPSDVSGNHPYSLKQGAGVKKNGDVAYRIERETFVFEGNLYRLTMCFVLEE